jgi:hypothetical protein
MFRRAAKFGTTRRPVHGEPSFDCFACIGTRNRTGLGPRLVPSRSAWRSPRLHEPSAPCSLRRAASWDNSRSQTARFLESLHDSSNVHGDHEPCSRQCEWADPSRSGDIRRLTTAAGNARFTDAAQVCVRRRASQATGQVPVEEWHLSIVRARRFEPEAAPRFAEAWRSALLGLAAIASWRPAVPIRNRHPGLR